MGQKKLRVSVPYLPVGHGQCFRILRASTWSSTRAGVACLSASLPPHPGLRWGPQRGTCLLRLFFTAVRCARPSSSTSFLLRRSTCPRQRLQEAARPPLLCPLLNCQWAALAVGWGGGGGGVG
jgi:hypothetical protein